MQFRTEIENKTQSETIHISHSILTMGSCFSDVIGARLHDFKFKTHINPFGTTFNPISLHKLLHYALLNELPADHTYLTRELAEFNYDFHSSFTGSSQADVQKKIAEAIGFTHHTLKSCNWLVLTYGTSWVYTRNDSGEIVNNCHKIPGNQFSKELLSQKRILEDFATLHQQLKAFNPKASILLTVSPVRHTKDTLELNSVGKAILRLTCHTLVEQFSNVHYFPAFEIMNDDLRDYRFYKKDLIHPNEQAEDYIWEKFSERWFDAETKSFVKKWHTIQQALHHKPFNPGSEQHHNFLLQLKNTIEEVQTLVDVTKEIEQIEKQLHR